MKIVTLVSGDYHKAAVALINSCAANGFTGEFHVFFQGSSPPWQVKPHANVTLQKMESFDGWIANLKPKYINRLADGKICFIDADCIVPTPRLFRMLDQFLPAGPVLCSEGLLPASDLRWRTWTREMGNGGSSSTKNIAEFSCVPYLNAGFVALSLPRDGELVDRWEQLVEELLEGGKTEMFEKESFLTGDQDCLNAVVGSMNQPFSSFGPPDVWFRALPLNPFSCIGNFNDPILLHCTGKSKSWRVETPMMSAPDIYDKAYYRFTHIETPWVELERDLSAKTIDWFRDTKQSRRSIAMRRFVSKLRSYLVPGTNG